MRQASRVTPRRGGFRSVTAAAAGRHLEAASGLTATHRLDHVAAAGAAVEHPVEEAAERTFFAARGIAASRLTAAGGLADRLATADRLAHRLTAADRLGGATGAVVAVEQLVQQALFGRATRIDDFAAADRLVGDFVATYRFATGVTAAMERLSEQAKRAGVSRADHDQCDRQQTGNEYSTHRESPWENGKGSARVAAATRPSGRDRLEYLTPAVPGYTGEGGRLSRSACSGGRNTSRCSQAVSTRQPAGLPNSERFSQLALLAGACHIESV